MKKSLVTIIAIAALAIYAPSTGMAQNTGKSHAEATAPKSDSHTFASRFSNFVDSVSRCDTLSANEKNEISATYKGFIAEYKVVNDSLSDADIRSCSKSKVRYQKAMARIFVNNASDNVADTAEVVGNSVSKFFRKTKKKVQGAIDGFKNN